MDSFNMNSFFDSTEFNSLDDGSKALLREFAQKASGKSQAEALAVLMEYRGKLDLSGERQKQLVAALKAGLSPENRKRLELMEAILYRREK